MERADLDEEHTRHERGERLELRVEPGILARPERGRRRNTGGGRIDGRAHLLVRGFVEWILERDVADGVPHPVVAGLVVPAGLVARMRLEQPVRKMRGRGAADVVGEVLLDIAARRELPDRAAVALDGADPGQQPDDRLANTVVEQELRLRKVRIVAGERAERGVEDGFAGALAVLLLPRVDRVAAKSGAR